MSTEISSARPSQARVWLSYFVILFSVATQAFLVTSCSKAKIEPFAAGQAGTQYALGKKVLFGESGDSERFRVSGWSSTEKEITWTEGPVAVLKFTGINTANSLRLKMTLAALVNPPQLPSQPVEVFANGRKIAEWQVGVKAEFTALLPPGGNEQGDALTIELKLPKAASPKALGLSEDPRVLGLSCFDLTISQTG
jgi:hypothetical protein